MADEPVATKPPAPISPINPLAPKPGAPAAAAPLSPISPLRPVSPISPVSPVSPLNPLAPVSPISPLSPLGKAGGGAPVSPLSPITPAASPTPIAAPTTAVPAYSAPIPLFRAPSSAQQESETGRAFPGYREFVQVRQRASDLQKRLDALTAELSDARKSPPSTAQKVHLHQLNNSLHRAGYELDTVQEEYRRRLTDLVDDATVDWMRMKSVWIQNEDQIFNLQMLQSKLAFLRQGSEQFEAGDIFANVDKLEQELDAFSNSHLAAGTIPDDPLQHFSQLVTQLSRILVSAHEIATEIPEWRPVLQKPPANGLSIEWLKETLERISESIKQIPNDITVTRRLLPPGSWRKESDLRPEIYAVASLLHPADPIHQIQVRDVLMYLDDDLDCRLRKAQVTELKKDEARCKEWLEAHAQHVRLIDKSKSLAKEGNYKKAEKFVKQTDAIFADLNYNAFETEAKPWKNELEALEKRLNAPVDEARRILNDILKRIWTTFGKFNAVRSLLDSAEKAAADEASTLKSFAGTDFHEDALVPIKRLRERIAELSELYDSSLRTARILLIGIALGLAGVIGGLFAIVTYTVKLQLATVHIPIKQVDPDDPIPTITLGEGQHQLIATTFDAKFEGIHAGTYPLDVTAPNYEPYHSVVLLKRSQHLEMDPILLTPISGFLRLEPASGGYTYEIRPAGRDRLYSSGTIAPDDAANLHVRPGRYDVTFIQKDIRYSLPLDVAAKTITTYSPDFRFSKVRITSQPTGAVVSIDGAQRGFTPFEAMLPPVEQSIAVEMEGFEKYYIPLTPKNGDPKTFDIVLRRVKATKDPVVPPPPTGPIPEQTPQPQSLPDQK